MSWQAAPSYGPVHDAVYQRLRNQGRTGWDTTATYAEMLEIARPILQGRAASLGSPLRVIELGCGAGELALLFEAEGHQVTGVDASAVAVEWAREKAVAANSTSIFVHDDVTLLQDFPDAAFDVAVDAHCLHCIIGADRFRALQAVRRVLRLNGALVVMTMCGIVTAAKVQVALAPDGKTVLHDGIPVRYVAAPEEVLAELNVAGFVVESHRVDPRESEQAQDMLIAVARRA
jgi:SAM-dependent methyltransferase